MIRGERLRRDAVLPVLGPLLRLEHQADLVHQAPLPLELGFHHAQVNHIHTDRRVNPLRVRLEVPASLRLQYHAHMFVSFFCIWFLF